MDIYDDLDLVYIQVEDGIKDCADGTDENIFVMSWWMLFLITLSTAVTGIALSFCCRYCQESCFQCGLCTSTRSKRARAMRAFRPVIEMADLHADCDTTACSQYKGPNPPYMTSTNFLALDQLYSFCLESFTKCPDCPSMDVMF